MTKDHGHKEDGTAITDEMVEAMADRAVDEGISRQIGAAPTGLRAVLEQVNTLPRRPARTPR